MVHSIRATSTMEDTKYITTVEVHYTRNDLSVPNPIVHPAPQYSHLSVVERTPPSKEIILYLSSSRFLYHHKSTEMEASIYTIHQIGPLPMLAHALHHVCCQLAHVLAICKDVSRE